MRKEDVTRYVRPEDVPLLDPAIIEPVLASVAQEMHEAHPEESVEEWKARVRRALLAGELLLVIDDRNRRLGLVPTDEPPFSGLVRDAAGPGAAAPADPLGLRRWETGE